jgi:hypothetical protein
MYNWKVLITPFLKTGKTNTQQIETIVKTFNLQGKRYYCSELIVFVYALAAQIVNQQPLQVFPINVGYGNILPVVLYNVIKKNKNWSCIGQIPKKGVYTERPPDFGRNYNKIWTKQRASKQPSSKRPTLSIPANTDIPEDYLCPISKDIMQDPVILVGSSITYERREIQTWLQKNNKCPVTGKTLLDKKVIPNIALKNAIGIWLRKIKQPQSKKKSASFNQGGIGQLKKQASEHYALAKAAIFKKQYDKAIDLLFLAKSKYEQLQRQYNISCSGVLEEIKLKLEQLSKKL